MIFGLGLSKTGTTSLTSALNILGIKAIHGPCDDKTQEEFESRKYKLSILEEYEAITDIPAALFYKEFDQIYPKSKFILTIRDVNSWLNSMRRHYQRNKLTHWKEYIRILAYGTTNYDPERLRFVYENHVKDVRNYFNTDRLLVMDIKEGWGRLCEFLGKDIPDITFPYENASPILFS